MNFVFIAALVSLLSVSGIETSEAKVMITAEEASYDLDLLKEITNISSESNDTGGVLRVQLRLKRELENMGFQTRLIENPKRNEAGTAISAPLLIGEYNGKNPRFVTLLGHADTVFKELTPYMVSTDGKIFGSGIGDNKGGLIVGLRTLREFLAQGRPKYSLRIIVSPNEEVGSPGFTEIFRELAADSTAVFGIEPSYLGGVLTARKGTRWYHVEVTGVEAHAGVAHEKGVNACLDLSIKIAKAGELTDYTIGSTINAGIVNGGKRANIVCGKASATLDTRFLTLEQDEVWQRKIGEIFSVPYVRSADGAVPTKTLINSEVTFFPPFNPSPLNQPYIQIYKKAIAELEGIEAAEMVSGGAADISNMTMPHLVMMDGLGPFTEHSHTSDEYITKNSMKTRPLALLRVLEAL